jgi:hypothetical protein
MAPEQAEQCTRRTVGSLRAVERPAPSSAGRGPGAELRSGEAHLPFSMRPLNAGQLLCIGGDP